jgi:hypothetical protein
VLGKRVASDTDAPDLKSGDIVNWAVERFTEAEWLRNTSFVLPATFKFDDYVDDVSAFTLERERVVVEFSKERAAYARGRTWHRTQQIEELCEGGVRISFWCRSLAPVTSWIFEWGPARKGYRTARARRRGRSRASRSFRSLRTTSVKRVCCRHFRSMRRL